MALIDDLTTAVATLTQTVADHDAAVQAEIKALAAAVAANSGAASDPAIATAIQNVSDASAKLSSETQAMSASLTPPSS